MISDSADGAPVIQIKSALEFNDAPPARMQTVGVNFDSSKVKRKVGKAKKEEGPMFLRSKTSHASTFSFVYIVACVICSQFHE